jgi:thiol:disulfide interchange protein DsbD
MALLIGALTSVGATLASGPGDVITGMKAYVSRDKVHAGETFKAALRLDIGPGWHVNANPVSDELLLPTILKIEDRAGPFFVLDILYPEPRMAHLGFSETAVAVYSEAALIGALVRAGDFLKPGTYALKGTVTWQACNDISCLPPESREFEMDIVVVEPGQETHGINAEVFKGMKFGFSPTLR